jgi:ATP-dependent helicase/nuclease subunit A
MEFNKAQRLAIEKLDQDISVSAGAGSGKTRVLVERFCRLVRDGLARPTEILTVTFTEKAAKEMKERIVARFREWSKEANGERFEQAAREVEAAYIGTIHGFAARILRENAFAAGIDPRFAPITETEADILGERVLEALMAKNFAAGTQEYIDLAFAVGRRNVAGAVKFLAGQTASLGIDPLALPIQSVSVDELAALARAYIDLAREIAIQPLEGTDAFVGRLEEFRGLFPSVQGAMEATVSRLAVEGEALYAREFDWDACTLVEEATKKPPTNVGGKDWRESFAKPVREAAEDFKAAMLVPVSAYQSRCLARVAADWLHEYGEAKKRRGGLDFNDLLLKTRDLLIGPDELPTAVARFYRSRFKYVMMDEFQDTNELQASLIRAVTPPDRFFTVGDIKQSIYSFIHSDVEVFQNHHRRIAETGGEAIPMTENYRSRPGIIDFVNGFFEKVWAEDPDFEFEALEASGDFHDDAGRVVEFIWTEVPPGSEADTGRQVKTSAAEAARTKEARAIAARIGRLLGTHGGEAMRVTEKDDRTKSRPLHAGDILILFRATSDIKIYERALAAAGINYYVVSGRGFYGSREVQDVINLLRAVDNPLDDIAMSAVLRSPFAGAGEDVLWYLSRRGSEASKRNGKLFTALRAVEDVGGLSERDRRTLLTFRQVFDQLRIARSESRLVKFLELAVELTSYDLKLLAGRDGKRRFANLRKLIDVARESAAAGVFDISEFIAHLERMQIVAQREGEAPTEAEESSVVRLMTVHGAKGLQAPVVFMADCSRRLSGGRNGGVFRFDKELGAAAKARDLRSNKLMDTRASKEIDARSKARDAAEVKRLLYVAATRAQEQLIFCGTPAFDGGPGGKDSFAEVGSWTGWFERALDINQAPEAADVTVEAGGLKLRLLAAEKLAADITPVAGQSRPVDLIEIDRGLLESGASVPVGAAPLPDIEAMERVASLNRTGPVDLTVSAVLDYLECPRKYRLRSLGVGEPPRWSQGVSKKKAALDPAAFGTAVHDVLASVDWSKDPAAELSRLVPLQETAMQEEIKSLGAKLLATPWPERFRAGQERMAEAPFSLTLAGARLYGRIDMLFKENGGWVVVDYKTGLLENHAGYETQVRLYALAVEKAVGAIPKEVVLVALGGGEDHVAGVDAVALRETESLLEGAAWAIRAGEFACRTGDRCDYCGYRRQFCKQ